MEYVFTDREQLRVRSKGVSLRIELAPAIREMGTIACHGALPKPDGTWDAVFGTYGKFLFKALNGKIDDIS